HRPSLFLRSVFGLSMFSSHSVNLACRTQNVMGYAIIEQCANGGEDFVLHSAVELPASVTLSCHFADTRLKQFGADDGQQAHRFNIEHWHRIPLSYSLDLVGRALSKLRTVLPEGFNNLEV